MKRKYRLATAIDSIGKQIDKHRDKLKKAQEENNPYLTEYYKKEIGVLEDRKRDRIGKAKRKLR